MDNVLLGQVKQDPAAYQPTSAASAQQSDEPRRGTRSLPQWGRGEEEQQIFTGKFIKFENKK